MSLHHDATTKRNHVQRERTYLKPREAANYLRLSAGHLAKLRVRGGGPRFRKFGRTVVYAMADLEAWAEAHSRESTSDAA